MQTFTCMLTFSVMLLLDIVSNVLSQPQSGGVVLVHSSGYYSK